MTGQDDGRETDREDDQSGQGRRTQDDDSDRDGWTPDAEKPQRKGDVTKGEPNDADAPVTESEASEPTGDPAADVAEDDADADRGAAPDVDEVDDVDADDAPDFRPPLESKEFPVTTNELCEEYGEYRVDTDAGAKPLKELLEPADGETFGGPDEVRGRIEKLADR